MILISLYRRFIVIKILPAFIFCLLAGSLSAQIPALERSVNVEAVNQRTLEVLRSIEQQSGCRFSFNSALIPEAQLISVSIKNKTVREALDKIFKGKLQYKGKGEYIILTKAPQEQKVITGYVENAKGEKVSGASVYDNTTMASATTDEYGYYEMKIRRDVPVKLAVSKSHYSDTIIPLQPAVATLQNIRIEEEKDTTLMQALKTARDTVLSVMDQIGDWTVEQFTRNPNIENIKDTLHSDFQFSLVPFIGTNGKLSGNVVNDWSVNLIGGYSRGTQGAEFAGMFNVNREDVRYVQFAGFSNIVGGNVTGLQIAGFNNFNLKKTEGIQFAGFHNLSGGGLDGLQFAGFANTNLASSEGVQFVGFTNINVGDFKGAQFSGFSNINSGKSDAVSVAGFFNCFADSSSGVQIAGFANVAMGKFEGLQVSGFVNLAQEIKGSQIGVFNFAETMSGVPIGVLSFVKKGYHKIELSYDELGYTGVALRTGVPLFYNIVTAGIRPEVKNDTVDWNFGYGLGVAPKLTNRLSLNVDLVSKQTVHGNLTDDLDLLNRLSVGADFQIAKGFSVFAGLNINGRIYEDDVRPLPGSESLHHFYSDSWDDNYNFTSWLGWSVGLRFF